MLSRCLLMVSMVALTPAFATAAAEAGLTKEQRAKVVKLIGELASEEFAVREGAEVGLKKMGGGVLPLVKESVAATDEPELKIRGKRVIKALSLEGEDDPNVLASLAREEALGKRYEDASKFYAKAAKRFRELGEKTQEDQAREALLAKAIKAEARQARASKLAQRKAGDQGGGVVVAGGGVGAVRVRVGAGGGIVIGGEEDGDKKEDW